MSGVSAAAIRQLRPPRRRRGPRTGPTMLRRASRSALPAARPRIRRSRRASPSLAFSTDSSTGGPAAPRASATGVVCRLRPMPRPGIVDLRRRPVLTSRFDRFTAREHRHEGSLGHEVHLRQHEHREREREQKQALDVARHQDAHECTKRRGCDDQRPPRPAAPVDDRAHQGCHDGEGRRRQEQVEDDLALRSLR